MTAIRLYLTTWGQWLAAGRIAPPAPVVLQIDALYASDQLPPSLREVIRLAYLDDRPAKAKYPTRSPTEFYVAKRIAEEAVAHMLRRIEAGEIEGPQTVTVGQAA